MLTQERLRTLLNYDPETGVWTALTDTGSGRWKAGREVGRSRAGNYRQVSVDGVSYLSHRLAWFYMTGTWPKYVDHKNGTPGDDRWDNLREATMSQNLANQKRPKTNKSGHKGVWYDRERGQWLASLTRNKRRVLCQRFSSFEEAAAAYAQAARMAFGDFARAE